MHINVVRRDIEVANHAAKWVACLLFFKPEAQCVKPLQFVAVLFATNLRAVGHVKVYEANPGITLQGCKACRDEPLLVAGQPWFITGPFVDGPKTGCLGKYGHTVIGWLAREDTVVPKRLNFGNGKFVVGELGLLQAKGIGFLKRKPLTKVLKPYP